MFGLRVSIKRCLFACILAVFGGENVNYNKEDKIPVTNNSKKVFSTIFAVAFLLFSVLGLGGVAYAETETTYWIRVLDDETALFPTASTIKTTCFLEKSYYLKVIDQTTDYFYVQLMEGSSGFPAITGYVLKDKVELSDQPPLSPVYPTQKLTVSSSNANLHFSPLFSSSILITATNTQTMSFYGSINQNDTLWYYVYFAGFFGYVDSNTVTAPQIPLHPTALPASSLPEPDPQTPTPTPTPVDPAVSVGEILMILFVAVLSIGLVLALFLPQTPKKRDERFDKYRQ